MTKTIAITGANGFIGTALLKALHIGGYHIKAFVHHLTLVKEAGVEYYEYDLSIPPDKELFKDVDILIHLAFHFKQPLKDDPDINITAALFLKSLNLDRYIFVSSFSASDETFSYYGKCKHQLERIFSADTIIRPGFVLGNGGLFSRLKLQLKKNRFVPLIAGGKQPLQTIYLFDLIKAIKILIESRENGLYHLAHTLPVSYKTLLFLISMYFTRKIIFVPVPVWMVRLLIMVSERMKHPVVTTDNLEGLLRLKYIDTSNDLKKLDLLLLDTRQSLEKLAPVP